MTNMFRLFLLDLKIESTKLRDDVNGGGEFETIKMIALRTTTNVFVRCFREFLFDFFYLCVCVSFVGSHRNVRTKKKDI